MSNASPAASSTVVPRSRYSRWSAHLDQERVSTRHDQRDQRERRRLALRLAGIGQPAGVHVALEVVDRHQRLAVRPGQRLGEVDAHEQRAREPGAVRDRDAVHVGHGDAGRREGLVQHGHDPAQVGPGRHLGDDAAGRRVERDLAGHDVGVDPAAVLDERDPGLVAGRLDGEQQRAAHAPAPGAFCAPDAPAVSPGASRSSGSASGAGAASSSARRRAIRSVIDGSASGSVVMISASSWLSL